jgi:hypothetical protein
VSVLRGISSCCRRVANIILSLVVHMASWGKKRVESTEVGGKLTSIPGVHPVNASSCPFPDTQAKSLFTSHKIEALREGIKDVMTP